MISGLDDNPKYLALLASLGIPALKEIVDLYKEVGNKEASIRDFWDFFDQVQSEWRESKSVDSILGWF